MKITRIDFEGRHEINGHAGHWYATAQRRDGMHNGTDFILVTIFSPTTPDGHEHYVNADCEEDIFSMADCLQEQLDGYEGSNSEKHAYYTELLRISNC